MDTTYRQDIEINEFDLLDEWERQPGLYIKWAERAAKAEKIGLSLGKQRKIKQSELYKKYRKQFVDNSEKFTDMMLDAHVRSDQEYKDITNEWINAEEEAQILADVKWAFQQRKSSLEQIQDGIKSGLFSAPQEKKEKKLEAQKGLRESLKNKRRRE